MPLVSSFLEIFQRPATIVDVFFQLMELVFPIWIALAVGVFVGWIWKPKWVKLNMDTVNSTSNQQEPPKSGDSLSQSRSDTVFPQFYASMPSLSSLKLQLPSCVSWLPDSVPGKENSSPPSVSSPNLSSPMLENEKSSLVNWDDFKHFHDLVEEKDGGAAWIQMMDRSTPSMSYQAWRRDPEVGPPQYRSRTIYEDATPEILRDFFGDDEFRSKWDDMLTYSETLDECPTSGTMVVQWVRKFPFFCSDREYIIGRRIWHSGNAYYCVTKGVPSSSVPRRSKPRRVDLYYSSWCIRAAESKRDGRPTACEVLLFHHEDMGIPWEIAKLGVRQGMWGAVKKIEPGLRAYQKHRASGAPLSRSALMAQVTTKVCVDSLESLENGPNISSIDEPNCSKEVKHSRSGIPKMLVIGGAVALACSFDRGLLTKAVIFGVARKFANIGGRL
ncbi:phosphatidylcholine transfer protein [Dorcoceras hygrometricum]|uniref:Phosphatidylcholine transfer protein n=1 Tax=Dorcoceras hygrometricum TaxID=472368 RepID=A0A2Z7AL71_9LAMI|nr:phosphatidylcholine transfer protein [Dorcoceras hygrometricum]